MQRTLFTTDTPTATVYTDGGCDPNPGPGGWAVTVHYADRQAVLSGNAPSSTNNRMELEAAIAALAYLHGRHGSCEVDLHTDSTYLRSGITSWVDDWFARGWRTKGGQPVKNQDLWRRLYELSHALVVRWHWVKGHAGDPANERVDRLAAEARARLGGIAASTAAQEPKVELSLAVSCRGGQGGWAAVIRSAEGAVAIQGGEASATSNALYLVAATEGLRALDGPRSVTVYAPSDYLVQGATQWVHAWQRRGWQTKNGSEVKNRASWEALLEAVQRHTVRWQKSARDASTDDLGEARRLAAEQAVRGA